MSLPSSHLGGFRVLGVQVSQASWPSSAGERSGGARVKRKGVEGRTRTPPLCGASSGVAVSGVGIPKGAGGIVLGIGWWEEVKTLTEVLPTAASRTSWETRGTSPLSSPNLTHTLAPSPPE